MCGPGRSKRDSVGFAAVAWLSLACFGGAHTHAIAQTPSFTPLGIPTGGEKPPPYRPPSTTAYSISADGSVVAGWYSGPLGSQAFRWTREGGMELIGGDPNSPTSIPFIEISRKISISGDGSTIAGGSATGPTTLGMTFDGQVRAGWVEENGVRQPWTSDPRALAALMGWGSDVLNGKEAFLTDVVALTDGTLRYTGIAYLGGYPDELQYDQENAVSFVFDYSQSLHRYPFFRVLDPGPGFYAPDDRRQLTTEAWHISNDGRYAVGRRWFPLVPFPTRWDLETGEWIDLEFFGNAAGVSADGSVVVNDFGSIWTEASGRSTNLGLLLESLGLSQAIEGWKGFTPLDVSDDGLTVVGYAQNPDGQNEAWIATIPEPGVMLPALALAASALRRRRSATAALAGQ